MARKKKEKEEKVLEVPSLSQIEAELQKENHKHTFGRVMRSTIYTLLIVAAAAVLVAVIFLPVLQITGDSVEWGYRGGTERVRLQDWRGGSLLL